MAYQSLGIGAAADDGTGDSLRIGGDKINDNFVELYTLLGDATDLSSGISATSTVITLTNPVIATSITHADSVKAYYGTGNDLEIYHSGSHSYINDAGTGNLYLAGDNLALTSAGTTESYLQAVKDGAVTLYYDNAIKLATASAGISVTGTITTSGNIELGTSTTLIFEGSTADAYETTLTVTDPTADRTITLPNITGTVVTTGDSNTVTGTMITTDTVVEANMANDAIGSAELKTLSTLLIKNSSGTTLKTCHCAGA